MAIHPDIPSMLQESLPEMLLTAKYCIEFQKDTKIWPAPGCYGYPAALLLLSIADSIGSYIEKGNVQNHFKILQNSEYYDLTITDTDIQTLYDNYRNLLAHNSVIAINVILSIGSATDLVIQKRGELYLLNLVPLYNSSVKAVQVFLNNPQALINNKTIENIEKKS